MGDGPALETRRLSVVLTHLHGDRKVCCWGHVRDGCGLHAQVSWYMNRGEIGLHMCRDRSYSVRGHWVLSNAWWNGGPIASGRYWITRHHQVYTEYFLHLNWFVGPKPIVGLQMENISLHEL